MWAARLALLAAFAGPAAADDLDDLIDALPTGDYDRRHAIQQALRAKGYAAVPRLAAAYAETGDPRVRTMLDELSLYPDGESQGLGARMIVEPTNVRVGEEFVVTVVIRNWNSRRLRFPRSPGMDALETVARLRIGPEERFFELPSWAWCGTGRPTQGGEMASAEQRTVRFPIQTASDGEGRASLSMRQPGRSGEESWRLVIEPGDVRIHYVLDGSLWGVWCAPGPAPEDGWAGILRREVFVHLVE